MELINATGMQAGYTLGLDPDGREHLVVAVKGTFDFPEGGGEPSLSGEQEPLVEADTFTGAPGKSAPVYESDFPLRKPRCDVLLLGTAYAPGGKPAKKVQVGMKVGSLAKVFDVIGDRAWQSRGMTVIAGSPNPFTEMPVTYDRAFGGTDDQHPDPKMHDAYMPNPIGRGFHRQTAAEYIDGMPLPNTQHQKEQVSSPKGKYSPMAFGPIGRGWEPRYKLAGTYDEAWLADHSPFLPPDFQDSYFQAAPADQQIAHPKGGEPMALLNLTPEGRTAFRLPTVDMPVVFFHRRGGRTEVDAVVDTILIEPDQRRLLVTWRASSPLKRNIFEVKQVLAGKMPRAWWRARDLGKEYHPSLGALARSKSGNAANGEAR